MKIACSQTADGRAQHYFVKRLGEFMCSQCGEVSNRMQRWGQPLPVPELAEAAV